MNDCSTQYVPVCMLQGGGTSQKPVCDLCDTPADGTMLAAADIRHAIVDKGFNPFLRIPLLIEKIMGSAPEIHLRNIKSLVQSDTSDWNICQSCLMELADYLPPRLSPTGKRMSVTPVYMAMAQEGGVL